MYAREKPEVSLPFELYRHCRTCLLLAARLHGMQASLCLALQAPAGERRGLRLRLAEDRHAPLQPSQGNSQVSAEAECFGARCAALAEPGVYTAGCSLSASMSCGTARDIPAKIFSCEVQEDPEEKWGHHHPEHSAGGQENAEVIPDLQ